jgi:Kef-type K+ transport system membrane component KefB
MESSAQFLLTLGVILLLGLLTSTIARRTFLPRVTLLLMFGVVVGADGLSLIPQAFAEYFGLVADMTLLMVGFLVGGKLTADSLRESAGQVFWIATSAAIVTTLMVSIGLIWLGVATQIAVVLGCIASATAPAAVLDVVTEFGVENRFSRLLVSIVALDDVLALVLFGLGVTLVTSINGQADELFLFMAAREIFGALLLGAALGFPAAYLTGRVKEGQPILTEALGLVFLCGGLAMWLGVSYLLAAMIMGAIVANFASHHEYPFHAIEGIESPLMVIFFVLAGVSLQVSAVAEIGIIGTVYIVCRSIGKCLGASLGSKISGANIGTRTWMGPALLPQAGVAIGMALVASNEFPEYRQVLLPVVIGSTVFFELIGPVFTRLALQKMAGYSGR